MSELPPPEQMTKEELAAEINQAERRQAAVWPDAEWRRFLAVSSEFIKRVGQPEIKVVSRRRTRHLTLLLVCAAVITLIVLGLLIFGHLHIEVETR